MASLIMRRLARLITGIRQYIFAWIYPLATANLYNTDGIFRIKTDLFSGLHVKDTSHYPGSVAVFKSGRKAAPSAVGPRVLELGVGPGANFEFYPPGCRMTLVDPNPYFEGRLAEVRKRHPQVSVENTIVGFGEDLGDIKSETMDAVVTTTVLCSCKKPEVVLQEIRRVLRPGGTYYFLEHVLGDAGSVHNYVQRAINRVWRLFTVDCNINRDIGSAISRAGFAKVQSERFVAPIKQPIRLFIGPHIVGTATK